MTFNNSRRSWISRFFGANAAAKPAKGKRAVALESLEDRLTPATWYIDPINGSNSGAGTQADPWATLQASLDKVQVTDGDELLISPGSMTEQGTPWVSNTETVSVLIQKSVAIRGTDAAWNPITDTGSISTTISLGSQGQGSGALLVVDAPNVTITGLQFDPINADAGNPVNGQGQLIFVLGNNVVLQDLNINTNRANADTQAVPGTTATAVYFYDPNPTLNGSQIVSSSISNYLVTENLINGTVVISNGTGFGQPSSGQLITNNQISKGLFGAVYLFGQYNDPNSTSIYDVGLPTLTGNIVSTFPFPTNPTDDVPGNFGAFQSLYTDQADRPTLSYIQAALANNTVVNYVAVSTPANDIRQQGDASTNYGFNVFPYLQALSSIVEQFLDANDPSGSPAQAGDTINVAAPDINPNVLNYNLLSANGAIVRVTGADPVNGFEVTLSDYIAPGGTTPNALSMTFARDTNLVPNSVVLSVFGNAGNNTLTGDPGNNAFTGGAGNDVIDGVDGIDKVHFSGSFTDYSFSYNSTTGILQVVDNRPGSPDGTDQLKNIESLVFDNGGVPQTVAIAEAAAGTTIQAGINDTNNMGVLILGNHSAEDVIVDRDVVLRGVADSATSTLPTANSFLLTNSAILQVGSGNVSAPDVTVNNGSIISDGVLLTSEGGTLNVDAGTYPPIFTDNNIIFYRSITLNAVGGQVFADAFTLQDNAVLSGAFSDFKATTVTVNPGSQLNQGVAMTDTAGTLFAVNGTYNEDVILDHEMVLASLGGLVTIHGSTASPLVINNQAFATVFLEGSFNFTSSATPTPSIEVTPGSYLGLTGNGSTGTAIINLQGDAVDGGHLELYGPNGPGNQIILNNRLVMGDNTTLYAQGTGIPDGGYTPTVSGILEFVPGANVTLGAAGGTVGNPSVLTINGPIIDNGVTPTIDESLPENDVIIQGALTAALYGQDLYILNSQTAVGSFTISVIINTALSGVDTLTLPGALVAQLPDSTPVPVTATFDSFTVVGNGGIATYTITPNTPPFSNGPAGPYLFYLKGVADNDANVLPDTLITEVQADFTQPTVTITPNTADPTNLETTNFTIQFSEGVTGLTQADIQVTGGTITNFIPDLFDTSKYVVTVAAAGSGERSVLITVTVPAGSASDSLGNPNLAGSGNITFDNQRPTPTISYSGPNPTNTSPLTFTVTWDEIVTDFSATDINLINASLVPGSFQQQNPFTYTFDVTPLANGTITVNIVENIAQDLAQNPNKASNTVNVVFDDTQPTVDLTAPLLPGNITYQKTVIVTLTTSEDVTLVDPSQLIVTGGTAGAITGSGGVWQVSVTVSTPGSITPITVQADAGLFQDAAGNLSLPSNLLSYTYRPAISQGLAWGSNGPSNGQGGNVITIQATNGNQSFVTVFPGWTGGVRVASGDVTGDGIQDYVVVPTAGGAPNVVVISGATNTAIASFYAMDPAYKGGLTVAVGDLNGDAIADIVVGTGGGAQATIATFAGQTFTNLKNFFVYSGYTGQVNVGTADITGAGTGRSIVTGTGVGAPPHVQVIDYTTLNVVSSFYAFPTSMTGGVFVAGGNLNTATAADEIVVGSGGGIQSTVNVFNPAGTQLNSLSVFPGFFGQTKVAITDYQGDGIPDLAVGAGPGSNPEIDILRGTDLAFIDLFYGYNLPFTQGINFGA